MNGDTKPKKKSPFLFLLIPVAIFGFFIIFSFWKVILYTLLVFLLGVTIGILFKDKIMKRLKKEKGD